MMKTKNNSLFEVPNIYGFIIKWKELQKSFWSSQPFCRCLFNVAAQFVGFLSIQELINLPEGLNAVTGTIYASKYWWAYQ